MIETEMKLGSDQFVLIMVNVPVDSATVTLDSVENTVTAMSVPSMSLL